MESKQPIYCSNCGHEMSIDECLDFCDDVCAGGCACAPDQHYCCIYAPAPLDYEPTFDASRGIWIHDPCDCKDYFAANDYPPQCAWRNAVEWVEQLYDDVEVGDYILVGYDSIPERWREDKEVEWALCKEEDGWSYHGIFAVEGMYGYIRYSYNPVADRREIGFTPIQHMGPVAPRIYPLSIRYVFHPKLQLKLHDPFQLIEMTEDGRFPQTFPAHIRIASPEFWKKALEEITWSMAAYDNPKAGEVIRITEAEYNFYSHDLPVIVRYEAEYDGAKWHPLMTIQHKGREFIGYDYDWCDVDPVNPPPALE